MNGLTRCSKTASYSITSSARAMSFGGTVRPSRPAVFKFMVSFHASDYRSTGSSDGAVP
jgi:hypothetical protein